MCSEYNIKTTPKDIQSVLGQPIKIAGGLVDWDKIVKFSTPAPVIQKGKDGLELVEKVLEDSTGGFFAYAFAQEITARFCSVFFRFHPLVTHFENDDLVRLSRFFFFFHTPIITLGRRSLCNSKLLFVPSSCPVWP